MQPGGLPQRVSLAAELRRLRQLAGLSTRELADRLDLSQNKVSSLERGRTTPKLADVLAWADACGSGPDVRNVLAEMAGQARAEALAFRGRTLAGLQVEARQRVRAARYLRVFCPTAIPGMLQTRAYITAVFASGVLPVPISDEGIAARLERQGLLHDESKRFEFIIGEAALRWRFGSPEAHAGQLRRLGTMAALPNVSLGVLPVDFSGQAWWHHEISLYEDFEDGSPAYAEMETLTATVPVRTSEDIDRCRRALDGLRVVATFGDAALALIASLEADVLS